MATIHNPLFVSHSGLPHLPQADKACVLVGEGVKFDRIRRITGYLVGTVDRMNDAKQHEVADRVLHVGAAREGSRRAAERSDCRANRK